MDEQNQNPPSSSGATRSVKKKREMDPFYNIEWRGDVDYFNEVPVHVLLEPRDEDGNSILSKAVIKQYISLVKVIYERCPELLYCQNNHGRHALHHAAARQNLEVLNFIINADVESQGRGANKRLTRMQDNDGNVALMVAVQAVVVAKNVELLITADPEFYPPPNHEDETPLKWCMSHSRRSMSDFGMQDMISDMISDMFMLLLSLAPNQSKTHMGSNGWTILHYAASEGDLRSIADILRFCPDCSEEVDYTGQNFLHVAAAYEQVEVVRHLLEYKKIPASVLNMKDNNGNTPLHIAARSGNVDLTKCFLCNSNVDKTTLDKFWQHVLEAFNFDYDKRKAGVSGVMVQVDQNDLKDQSEFDFDKRRAGVGGVSVQVDQNDLKDQSEFDYDAPRAGVGGVMVQVDQNDLDQSEFDYDERRDGVGGVMVQVDQNDLKDLKDQSDFDLVVGALIATVTFTVGITIPGGYISDGPNKGTAVLSKKRALSGFVIFNTFALLFSLSAVFSHYYTRGLTERKDILPQLKLATYCILGAISAMTAAFISGSFAVLADSIELAILVCAIGCCFYIMAILPMWKIVMQERGGSTGGQWRLRFGVWRERLGWGRAVKNPSLSPHSD